MSKPISRKPFYTLAEVCDRWSLGLGDVAAYALEGELSLSLPVAALPVEVSDVDCDSDGKPFRIPGGRRRHVGTVELNRVDAFTALEQGAASVTRFYTIEGEVMEPLDEQGERCSMLVERTALVVRHAEFERFEARHATLPPLAAAVRTPDESGKRQRGAPPKYDWEGALCEMIVIVNDEGVPATQGEMVERMQAWFAQRLGPDNVPCDSSIKRRVSRFWNRIKPDVGKPSALQSIHAASPAPRGRETGRPAVP